MTETEKKFLEIQNSLKDKISLSDNFKKDEIKNIAGVDLAYWKNSDHEEYAVCCIVVIDFKSHKIVEKKQYSGKIECPYISGFLAFRELPLVLKTVEKLETSPDIYMFDGNGYLHPRHMGLASHASFYLNKPSIGVAKSYFRVENTDYIEPDGEAGSFTDIIIKNEVYGRVLRTHSNVRPVFVSVGNNISLDTSSEIVMSLVEKDSHIPLPTRFADLETHEARRLIVKN
ncbi:MAG: endonuclease V [Oscillospiraceae bacterium]|nr:endonuclease V [Oscillospiraceae bacterium]